MIESSESGSLIVNSPRGHIDDQGGEEAAHHGGEEGSDDHGEGEQGHVLPGHRHDEWMNE